MKDESLQRAVVDRR